MLSKPFRLILTLLGVLIVATSCSEPTANTTNSQANLENPNANANRAVEPGMEGAKDNADELRTLIHLPYEPDDLVWKEYTAGEPGGKQARRLLAVFQFTADDKRKVLDAVGKIRPGTPVSFSSEKWFPKELITQSEIGGEEGIQATSYAADEFLQPPYSEGTLSHVDNTDFFVLEAFAK